MNPEPPTIPAQRAWSHMPASAPDQAAPTHCIITIASSEATCTKLLFLPEAATPLQLHFAILCFGSHHLSKRRRSYMAKARSSCLSRSLACVQCDITIVLASIIATQLALRRKRLLSWSNTLRLQNLREPDLDCVGERLRFEEAIAILGLYLDGLGECLFRAWDCGLGALWDSLKQRITKV